MSVKRRLMERLFGQRRPSGRVVRVSKLTPHAEDVAALKRKRAELTYEPKDGFHADRIQEKQT